MIKKLYLEEKNHDLLEDYQKADRFMLALIFIHWILVSSLSAMFYNMYALGIVGGGALFLITLISYKLYSGTPVFRILTAIVLMTFTIISVQQNLGRIEMHFHVFIALSFLTVYKDLKPAAIASIYIVLHHLLFTYLQLNNISIYDFQIMIYNYGCGYDIALLHAVYVFFEFVILYIIINTNTKNFNSMNLYKSKLISSNNALEKYNKDLNEKLNIIDKDVLTSHADKEGNITDVSTALCKLSGYTKEELIGRPQSIFRHPDTDSKIFEDLWNSIENGEVWENELKNKKKDGDYYWIRIVIYPEYDENNNLLNYLSIQHDITAQKVRDEFLANMSHELRTPLNSIIGFSDILYKKISSSKDQKYVEYIQASGKQLLSLINDILDLSKIQNSEFKVDKYKFNPYDEIQEYSKHFRELTSQNNIDFSNIVSNELDGAFIGDWLRISQIISNLTSNAIKFTPKDGVIKCNTNYIDNNLVFTIMDNGIGMSKSVQDKVFKPFTQADGSTTRKYGGTGLGLSIAQKLVEAMKGTIELKSKENEGTTFIVTIPLEKSLSEFDDNQKNTTIEENLENSLNGHVLIVEDNKTNQMLMMVLLEEFGLTYDIANNGLEAVEMYNPDIHKLILMDENMPIMNGLIAMKEIRKKYKDRCGTIIALTANIMSGDKERLLKEGMDCYLSKPVDLKELHRVLKKFL